MNQILVTEKLYITPELKRKKRIYKFNFIASIIIIFVLCLFYARSEYAKSKEEEISQGIMSQMVEEAEKTTEEERKMAEQDDNVWKIMMASTKEENQTTDEQNIMNNQNVNNNSNTTVVTTKKRTTTYSVKGKRYQSIGRIRIPKIDVDQVILDKPDTDEKMVEWLKISPCKFYGVDPNEIGNCSIAGHNYRNKRFFSKVPNLVVGDKILVTDVNKKTVTYSVYNKYTVYPDETDCVKEEIPGTRIITLITCTDDGSQRVIIHAKEV